MPFELNSPGWRIRAARRGARAVGGTAPGLPPGFLTEDSRVAEEVVLEATPATRGQPSSGGMLDLTCDVEPGEAAILAIRHASNALTFHLPVQSTSRGRRGSSQARFQIAIRQGTKRGLASQAIKAIVVKVARLAGDKLVTLVLPKLVEAFEKNSWKKRGLEEGWLLVTEDTLAAAALATGTPVSPQRSLLFIHGTFSDTASAFRPLASSSFFERVKDVYDDRIFAFDHFSLSRTLEENARMLLEGLPEQTTTFDVITHSRGGLVLRTLVERASRFGPLARRFSLGRAVLVASPNEGTPLATPGRWDQTLGWIANVLELFPDNPFATGAEFVANGLVWLANHVSGDIPGLHALDAQGDPITEIQKPPGPPADAYSALVANYNPTGDVLHRLLDAGLDQFFGSANDLVMPSEGGWRIDRSSTLFIPASRIGCFGPGGNLPGDSVTHVSFFSRAETVDFLVNALTGRRQPLNGVDPRKPLPHRRILRGEAPVGPRIRPTAGAPVPMPSRRAARAGREPERLHVSVTNGDLTFEPEALLIGHYASTRLTGTEGVMDRLIGGAMEHSLRIGLYPLSVGAHEIFINDHIDQERGTLVPRPAAVIVVGLGPEGTLAPGDLVRTVRLAVIGWARRLAEPGLNTRKRRLFELASTLLGSGGTGVSAGQAARLITQGVSEANELLQDEREAEGPWPRCRRLGLIEVYLDRATEAWHALRLQQAVTPDRFEMDDFVRPGVGALQRQPDSGYRGADYDFITVETKEEKNGEPILEYTLDTRRARSEVRGRRTQSRLVKELVTTASNDQNRDQRIGRTLFSLLIPVELEAYLANTGEMQMALDPETAAIPWELLDVSRGLDSDQRPWAIRVKLLRKLRLETFRDHVVEADADSGVLLIGEPACPEEYPRLPGARNEAIAAHTCLTGPGALDSGSVTLLIGSDPSKPGPDAEQVINTLFERPWRIVHIAGHGAPGANGKSGGVVLSNGTFLGSEEIRSMRVVPELVFVNCCYLGGGDEKQLLNTRYNRARFASGVAGALIEIGVRSVVAAGWAVDDDAACEFASAFYASLLRGNRFIDAVGEARAAAYERNAGVNTWAAYQCYGDPDWRFQPNAPDANRAGGNVEDFSGVASAASLGLELERIVVQTQFQGYEPATQVNKLQELEKLFGERWGRSGAVAELFGQAYAEAGATERAVLWYERALNAPDGRASMKAAGQLGDARSRFGWETIEKALLHRDEMARQQNDASTPTARASARAARADAEKKLNEAFVSARALSDIGLTLLNELAAFKQTMERENLVASAFRRRALVDMAAGHAVRVRRDLAEMKKACEKALRVGKTEEGADLYYAASNCLAADVALGAGKRARLPPNGGILDIVQQCLEAKSGVEADFRSVVGNIELEQYRAVAARKLGAGRARLERLYRDLYERAKSARMWASVYDNASLVLGSYAGPRSSASAKEKQAAKALLTILRTFAHPVDRP